MLETAWESRWLPDYNGGVAQLGEHLPCKQGVKSSNLSVSIVPIKQLVLTCTLKTSYEKDFDLKINQDIRETNQNVVE